MLHIPFFAPEKPSSPMQLRKMEMMLKTARINASASIGVMISMGKMLLTTRVQEYLEQQLLPLVVQQLPNVHFRVQKCYALLLTAAKLVSYNT